MTTPHQEGEQKCRICSCTNERACEGGCHWIEFDLCSSHLEGEDEFTQNTFRGATNLLYPTTSPTTQSWEDRFDKLFPRRLFQCWYRHDDSFTCGTVPENDDIKSFISQTLATAEAEWKQRLVESAKKMKMRSTPHESEQAKRDFYNQAVEHFITLINSTK